MHIEQHSRCIAFVLFRTKSNGIKSWEGRETIMPRAGLPLLTKNYPFPRQQFLYFWLRCFGVRSLNRDVYRVEFSRKSKEVFVFGRLFFSPFVVTMIPGSKSGTVEKARLCLFGKKPHL